MARRPPATRSNSKPSTPSDEPIQPSTPTQSNILLPSEPTIKEEEITFTIPEISEADTYHVLERMEIMGYDGMRKTYREPSVEVEAYIRHLTERHFTPFEEPPDSNEPDALREYIAQLQGEDRQLFVEVYCSRSSTPSPFTRFNEDPETMLEGLSANLQDLEAQGVSLEGMYSDDPEILNGAQRYSTPSDSCADTDSEVYYFDSDTS